MRTTRHRKRKGEPRTCRFFLENGQQHGIELTDDNSYKTSPYCKQHHNEMVMRARQQEPGRTSNIRRVVAYKQRNAEKVNANRRELRAAKSLAAQLGIGTDEARRRLRLAQTPPPQALPELLPEVFDQCFKPAGGKKYHIAEGRMCYCRSYTADPRREYVALPGDSPELSQGCKKRALAKALKTAEDA